ncbi:M48 family metallopeptidase [Metabacillus iocasae]|uniref:Metal-dependent hydrolase n=1 Tax=Priestia iocasae TaxID=2291674 RepID=A0ABS2QS13_9BACI|nr:YgjP-like metallopeptidase domain-containing protein [Metabacillus iocasae]MBM7702246.1 putative metal-dependent hydrolase [Metabacillus iocasae]
MYTYHVGNQTIDYKVEVVPNKTNISVQVCENEGVTVVVPRGLNLNNVRFVLARQANWILTQLNGEEMAPSTEQQSEAVAEKTNTPKASEAPSFAQDDKFSYLGRLYRLNIVREDIGQAEMTFRAKFIATLPNSLSEAEANSEIQSLLTDWYQGRAKDKFQEALKEVRKLVSNAPKEVQWEDLQQTPSKVMDGEVVLNWRLLMAPLATIEYVIASHITDADALYEDAAERKQWLQEHTLTSF